MDEERKGGQESIGSLVDAERQRLLAGASDERARQFHAAEEQHKVYEAWNEVCAGTREGNHVTGLHYIAESNELIVYMDAASWTQEMTMLREIIRARMEFAGAKVDGILFKTSREGYRAAGASSSRSRREPADGGTDEDATASLTPEELEHVDALTDGIEDQRLRKALKNAMTASLEWSKTREQEKMPQKP